MTRDQVIGALRRPAESTGAALALQVIDERCAMLTGQALPPNERFRLRLETRIAELGYTTFRIKQRVIEDCERLGINVKPSGQKEQA